MGITWGFWDDVLSFLLRQTEPVRLNVVAQGLGVSPRHMLTTLDDLISRGYVGVVDAGGKGAAVLTDEGRHYITSRRAAWGK